MFQNIRVAGAALWESDRYNNLDAWTKKITDPFIKLLHQMSKAMGYGFDEVQLSRDCYRPEIHGDIENAQLLVLRSWGEVLQGKRLLPVAVISFQ
jgi:hypothetical protein